MDGWLTDTLCGRPGVTPAGQSEYIITLGNVAMDDQAHNNGDRAVLVVEDDREVNELVGAYVRLAGFDYHCALDGASALRQAECQRPCLIVLDVMLPDLDGFEVCRRLKDQQPTSRIPILMLTALDREEYRQRSRACGAVAYLTKPFDPDQLMAAMRASAADGKAR